MDKKTMVRRGSDLCLAAALSFFLISAAVILTLGCRPLYYFDIGFLKIPEYTGYSESEIRENYDALIDYNIFPQLDTLKFPSFPMSEEGRIHFEEVKAIFQFFLKGMAASALLLAFGAVWKRRRKEYGYLLLAGAGTPVLALAFGIFIAAGWERAFVLFHKVVFANDYWLFDPQTDPVIDILPDAFFLHCALLILGLILAGCALCLLLWAHARRKKFHSPA